jgi:putative molybdopterin biosynthesis protein
VVQETGELLVHGVAVRPGHPVILGMVDVSKEEPTTSSAFAASGLSDAESADRRIPIIGVPGYPVSAALTGEIFVEPLLARWLGRAPIARPRMRATMTRKVQSSLGDDEFMRVAVGKVGERTVAAPLSRGAGVISSLVRADGIVRIPRFSEGVHAGEEVTVELYREPADIERTIVTIGSHDLVLDLLAQFLAEQAPGMRLASANAGSLGGMVALRRNEAHLAGSHLLHPDSGEYNVDYVKQYLPERAIVLVTLTRREQGLIIAPGNPKNVASLADLERRDVRYVNRQRGAGTRVLLDYRLEEMGIDPAAVQGYEREEVTHLAVAAAIASGVADCGLGIRAAARALQLGFVPIEWERYDLVIPREHYESALLQPMLHLLNDPRFRSSVEELSGYDPEPMGQVVAVIEPE